MNNSLKKKKRAIVIKEEEGPKEPLAETVRFHPRPQKDHDSLLLDKEHLAFSTYQHDLKNDEDYRQYQQQLQQSGEEESSGNESAIGHVAATMIQKVWRGFNTRKIIAEFIQQYTQQ